VTLSDAAEQALKSGDPHGALARLQEDVRARPADAKLRNFLFQLLCVVGQWERALNGRAIRIMHSLNDGAYGGEVIVRWDEQKQAVCYHYFTTDTFWTEGTMTFSGGKITSH